MIPVVATRLRPPTRAGAAVPREVLPAALAQLHTRRLLFVRAPAGYGKSSLMAQIYDALHASKRESTAWISVADIGASIQGVALHCATALEHALPELVDTLKALFQAQMNTSAEAISALLCNELGRVTYDLYLFLDDLHVLNGLPAERLLECLLRDAPGHLHFAVASRSEPTFSLSRLRAQGELGEVDAQALRFSQREAQLFFEGRHLTAPSAELIELARAKTEGWAVGLQLISISVDNECNWEERLRSLSGSNRLIGMFLAEDVLLGQSETVQRFLQQSSVLRQFNASLCDEVGQRSDSREIIAHLQRSGLFIFSLDEDDQWDRYHQLFSQLLQKRLGESNPSRINALHLRAAQWFRERRMLDDAMFHACVSKNFRLAASILDEVCNDLFYQGQLLSLMTWVSQIPERILSEFPGIQLIRVWNLTLEWRFGEAASLLASVIKRIRTLVESGSLSPEEASRLHRLYQHRRMMLAKCTDDVHTAARIALELRADFPEDDPYLRGSVELCLLYSQRECYRLDAIYRLDSAARSYFERAKSQFVLIWHESSFGPALVQLGELDRASDGYRSAMRIAEGVAGPGSPLGSMPALLLAELKMERGEYDEARALWDQYLPVCEEIGVLDHLIAAYVGRARLAALDGDYETASATLARATQFAQATSLGRLMWHATAEKVRLATQRNDIATAVRIATEARLPRDAVSVYPNENATTSTEAMAVTWIRLALARGFAKEAEALAKRWQTFAVHRSCIRTQIRMDIFLAASKLAYGDRLGATRALMGALGQAMPRRIVLPFLEEGEGISQAIGEILGISAVARSDMEYSAAILKVYGSNVEPASLFRAPAHVTPEPAVAADGRLSQREIDILAFVSQGLQNKEIADRLSLAEGSVKWYMQQIYAKLGVRRRLKAFQRARALGLIRG